MKILRYFDLELTDSLVIYRLRRDSVASFVSELTDDFRRCYIEDADLEELSAKNEMAKSEFLENFVIPDIGNIKSGDFGEMLSFFSMLENYLEKGLAFSGPHKWLWKDRNKAALYTDAVAFHMKDSERASSHDMLVSIESKMEATKQTESRIQAAVNGAQQDRVSRLASTLVWLREKYARIGDLPNRKVVERFIDPSVFGSYIKVFKAMTIIDSAFEDKEITASIEDSDGIVIVVFSIEDLKSVYERNRQNIFESVRS